MPSNMIQPGALLQNRYRVAQQIGQGGMGAVYLATDERFQSTVAIKQTFFFEDATLRKSFEREAQLLNHLRHGALPKVTDHFIEDAGQFLVMEFIEGSDLWKLMQERRAAFPLADVLRWADELLDALDYLHTHKPPVLHRDIKPQNMKLTPRGQIVLLDFGLAKGTLTQTQTSLTASVMGYSPYYAPLEQIQGTGTDARSDIYSLGATLYHLLTGTPPVDALTRASAVINNQPDPLRPAHVMHAQVPASVGKVIQRVMSQKAALRPTTAAEMRDLLRQAASPHVARQTPAQFLRGRSATDATMLESSTGAPQDSEPSALPIARTEKQQPSQSYSETTIKASPRNATGRTQVLSSGNAPIEQAARSLPVKMLVLAAVLAVCAVAAFTFINRSNSPDAKSQMQSSQQLDTSGDAQGDAPAAKLTAAPGLTTSSQSSTEQATARAPEDQSARQTNGAQTSNAQSSPAADAKDATNSGAASLDSNSSSSSAPTNGREGLVIQRPAPSPQPADSRQNAIDEAQRAEDARREEEIRNRPMGPPPPPPGDGRMPPPQGGGPFPPPPRRSPRFP